MTKLHTMTAPAKPREVRSGAPRAQRGTKAAALTAARKADLKTFIWKYPHHRETLHGTAGSGQCRLCVARFKKDHGERVKALKTEHPEMETA